ncbi:MAG: haloalkane dehalogenase [Gammaproteobacteria bacterium]|nr:haloalkane dehalogenase [Gammaproteobacteria bacterium]
MIAADMAYPKQYREVFGKRMAYVDVGSGDPIVFLHGNPTSSYLWRNVIPHVQEYGRCIAPDLIGMGDSDKIERSGPDSYRFSEHRDYLEELLIDIDAKQNVILVVHDWGSALGFDWANRHREAVSGIAYMEAIVRPLTWDEWPAAARSIFEGFRSDGGEEMILERNLFVERVLPNSIIRELTDAEMNAYRAPFRTAGEDRRPTLTWPRQIPIDGEPEDVTQIVSDYAEWLQAANVPKLLINARPGSILVGNQLEFCRGWPNQTEVNVDGLHFIQEDSPDDIGRAVAEFVTRIRAG